jgi:spore maturation protein CgeB
MEIAAMGRPMVAEKTEEHDSHFTDGREYLGFAHDDELIENVRQLVSNDARRISIGNAVRERCISAGYSTHARAEQMLSAIDQL